MNDAQAKTQRVIAAIERSTPDRVPIGEFFWTQFTRRAKRELGLEDFNPYAYWDLDLIVVTPNMDPHLTGLQILEKTPERVVVKTGFGATIERRRTCPMPNYMDFETRTYQQMEALRFDDPRDPCRYTRALDDQINGVGDDLNLGLPSFVERVQGCAKDFCVFGSVCEPHEMIWRIMGTENVLIKLAEDPLRMGRFIERLGDFLVGIVEGQIQAGQGVLKGLYIWGDIAYDRGMFFSPQLWREVYKPQLARICEAAHRAGLRTVYHGCGNAEPVFEDLIQAGVDCLNPIEAKAGLDVVDLKRRFGKRWSFNGNLDVRVLATNDPARVRAEVLRKLNAAKAGGYILQSDHSVPGDVSAETYGTVVSLARKHGVYPLDLAEFDESI